MNLEKKLQLRPLLKAQVDKDFLIILEHGNKSYVYNFMRTLHELFPGKAFLPEDEEIIKNMLSEVIDEYLNNPE